MNRVCGCVIGSTSLVTNGERREHPQRRAQCLAQGAERGRVACIGARLGELQVVVAEVRPEPRFGAASAPV